MVAVVTWHLDLDKIFIFAKANVKGEATGIHLTISAGYSRSPLTAGYTRFGYDIYSSLLLHYFFMYYFALGYL